MVGPDLTRIFNPDIRVKYPSPKKKLLSPNKDVNTSLLKKKN